MSTQEVMDAVEQNDSSTQVEDTPAAESETSAEESAELSAEDAQPQVDAESSSSEGPGDENASAGEGAADSSADNEAEGEGAPAESEDAEAGTAESTTVQRAEFQPLISQATSSKSDNMHLLLDVAVPVTIELGSTRMFLREILDLGPGAVVRLDRSVGDPVDVLVNGELVGRGEVVVVDDQFGVRVTELLRPQTEPSG